MDRETASAYLSGYLSASESQYWAAHVANCGSCQALVEEVSGVFDEVRRMLVLADVPLSESEIPPAEAARSQASTAKGRPLSIRWLTNSMKATAVLKFPRRLVWLQWVRPALITAAGVLLVFAVVYFFFFISSRTVLRAEEILRRAEQAAGSSRNVPGRIVHRAWKDSLTNGLGPLPDGEYRAEYWWDNVEHRFAYVRYDTQGTLREGNWLLADGTSYVFRGYGSNPELVVGPPDRDVQQEIERLPAGVRDQVMEYFNRSRRPFYEAAAEIAARTEQQITDISSGQEGNSSVHEVVLPSGQRLYRVSTHVDVSSPGAAIPHWDVTRLIADRTYLTIEEHATGYRSDGLIYERTKILREEQVSLPEEVDAGVFVPGPFPRATQRRNVSAAERVQLIERQLHLVSATQ